MSIYPPYGVAAGPTNTNVAPDSVVNCSAVLFYDLTKCATQFEPSAYNALLHELSNVFNRFNHAYDCDSKENLADVLSGLGGGGGGGAVNNTASLAVNGGNVEVTVNDTTGAVTGTLALQDLADAVMPLLAQSFTNMTAAEKSVWAAAVYSPLGSGWVDANGLYGEDDGNRFAAGFTTIANL